MPWFWNAIFLSGFVQSIMPVPCISHLLQFVKSVTTKTFLWKKQIFILKHVDGDIFKYPET